MAFIPKKRDKILKKRTKNRHNRKIADQISFLEIQSAIFMSDWYFFPSPFLFFRKTYVTISSDFHSKSYDTDFVSHLLYIAYLISQILVFDKKILLVD